MADKPMRLAKAAKEFNVGSSTIVDFLAKKGYDVSGRPTTKLDPEMVTLLQEEYAAEAKLKERADQIDIGSARRSASSKEKEEEPTPEPQPTAAEEEKKGEQPAEKKEEKKQEEEKIKSEAKLTGPKVVDKIDLDDKKPKKKEEPVADKEEEIKAEEEKKEEQPAAKKEEKKEKKKEKEAEKIETKKQKLTGPKVVDKVDLDKKPKKKEEPVAEEKEEKKEDKAEEEKKQETTKPEEQPAAKKEDSKEEDDDKQDTSKLETKYKELTGPKVLGKIELPKDKRKEKKKRKRIVKKKGGGSADSGGRRNNRKKGRKDNRKSRKNQQEDEPVSEQEIQDKIKETMARMKGQSQGGKSERSKYKRQKRKEHAEQREMEEMEAEEDNTLTVSEFIPLNELASLMDVAPTDLITALFSLGMVATINQRLDAEVIQLLGEEFGYEIEFAKVTEDQEEEIEEEDDPEDLEERNPIVTVMGHVDHGKTSLLDYIREANVIAGEAGGITQHIGAYEVEVTEGRKITFLDTPGHEAFTAMRARGAKVTDVAIIVIAADDSVMPQTKEAISHAQAAGVPMIFAFNKMDKPGANAEKIKEELSQMNILVEDWGGEYQAQEISAKTGDGIDELLEQVLVRAELLELQANPDKAAVGTVVEARLDKGRGYVASVLVQAGTLEIGDFVVAGQYFGKVKAMHNERGNDRPDAGPSVPVEILGLSGAPTAGETFRVYDDESAGKDVANKREQIIREQGLKARKHITLDEIGRRLALGSFKELNIIIKGDVDGSVEAMADSLQKLSTEEIAVNVIHKGVGQITESDILLASASDAVVIAFQVRPSGQARKLAEKEDIEIRMYSVIYDAIEEVRSAMEGMLEPKVEENIICNILVKETFKISKVGTIAGCEVQEGKAKAGMNVRLIRDGIVVYSGELESLRRHKDDVKEVYAGQECGLNIKNYNDVKVGDIIEGYEEVEVKRKLKSN